ncbi:SMAD/FHA domain-containing protein [Backusella circina FSU 941]|nr:SMAD/FHA domain-containing protein [Backusella circina FSU 941]
MMTEPLTVHEDTVKLPKTKMTSTLKRSSTLILKPHNHHFQTRTLELKDKVHVKIGRQTSTKTVPNTLNGYFDSKVLSRAHAEIWCDKTKVYIKDVKSSNGTFVNGQRLSNEGEESQPIELKTGDQVEFGIDIINDNGTVMYQKVACSVHLFPVPLSQMDENVLMEFTSNMNDNSNNNNNVQIYPDLSRKSSTSSLNTISTPEVFGNIPSSSSTTTNGKKSRNIESVLAKLQAELDRSKQVEIDLKAARDQVNDLESELKQDTKTKTMELEEKLRQAQATIASFNDKWKHQNQAIISAKQALHKLEQELGQGWQVEKASLLDQLGQERQRNNEMRILLEKHQRNKKSSSNGPNSNFFSAFQAMFVGVVSTLVYVLFN